MNELFRRRIISSIEHALREARDAASHDHPGIRGRIREIVVERLIKPLLPHAYAAGTGTIVDGAGGTSGETDIIVYDRDLLPPILYSDRDGVFPVESALFAIEVKSRLTAHELRDSLRKVGRIDRLSYSSGIHDERGMPQSHYFQKIQPLLFAFASDLEETGKSELDRYMEVDPSPDASIPNLCVVGRGFWWQENSGHWCFQPASPDHDEVILALALIVNSLPVISSTRGQPRFGWYILPHGCRRDMRVVQ